MRSVLISSVSGFLLLLPFWRGTPFEGGVIEGVRGWLGVVLVLAGFSLCLTLPPGETIPGGWDPSVYLQTATQISKQGGLLFDHPNLDAQPAHLKEILFRDVHGIPEPFGGMRLFEGKVTPQFYHVYPALMALVMSITGSVRAALWVNPLLNVISLLFMYRLTSMWTGHRRWGVLAMLLMMCLPLQIWQAKFSTAEMLTQVLVLGGMGSLLQWSRDPANHVGEAVLAGLSFGLAFLTRYDTLMLWMALLPILGFFAADRLYRKGIGVFLWVQVPLGILWCAHQAVAPFYRPLGPMVSRLVMLSVGLTLAAFVLARFTRLSEKLLQYRRPLLGALTLGWFVWVGIGRFVRPDFPSWEAGVTGITRLGDALVAESLVSTFLGPARVSMLYLESMWHPLGFAWVVLCVPLLWWRARGPAMMAWALSGLAVMVVLTWEPLNDLFMMWVARRFIPVVAPWLILASVLGLREMWEWMCRRGWNRRFQVVIIILWVLLLVGLQFPATRFMARNREWPGTLAWFESVAEQIPEDAVLYTDQPGFGAPFRFIWEKQAFELRRQRPELLRRLLDELRDQHPPEHPVLFLTASPMLEAEEGWHLLREVPLKSSMQSHHRSQVPLSTRSRGGAFKLYLMDE